MDAIMDEIKASFSLLNKPEQLVSSGMAGVGSFNICSLSQLEARKRTVKINIKFMLKTKLCFTNTHGW